MIEVLEAGLFTTIQDSGRAGYQKYGVSVGGAVDTVAHRLANIVIGNDENDATLEMTLQGAAFHFREAALLSITGGDMQPRIDGVPVPMWRPVYVHKGNELRFGNAVKGARTYIAVAGGFQADEFLGSASTYLQAGFGGHEGRAFQKGGTLERNRSSAMSERIVDQLTEKRINGPFAASDWWVSDMAVPMNNQGEAIRVFEGRHHHLFEEESIRSFTEEAYQVDTKSDRMGIRLKGEPLNLSVKEEIISEPVTFGTIQVPQNGQPIVLLADRQTTGGYPKLAQVASADFSKLGQVKPGDKVRFMMIPHREAERLLLEQEQYIRWCRSAIRRKVEEGHI
ncbi:5-oxoprolinase subunit C family protein [Salimicrobium halophilum]|uniref:Antagonist of KipI n=1 Tax=Salimicrobium halophilum TaxID=86666 RepID=A0A1G8UBH0_9BACI|nr:biotin-dependent carboxyltransferase family protein [Salimicrobium halophilum]SDJ51186.1 antagonist of KipI [Salimicrobium halophilum]